MPCPGRKFVRVERSGLAIAFLRQPFASTIAGTITGTITEVCAGSAISPTAVVAGVGGFYCGGGNH